MTANKLGRRERVRQATTLHNEVATPSSRFLVETAVDFGSTEGTSDNVTTFAKLPIQMTNGECTLVDTDSSQLESDALMSYVTYVTFLPHV